ncbi:PEP-CTERM sorting domain-containing protein [bacterium]|nr:MAG: PEP-CTERM sorting domain-containing protein [bacterium]
MNPARRSAFLARLARPGGLAGVIPPSPVPAANVASPTVPESLVPLGAGPLNDPTAPGDVARNFRDNPLAGATPQQFSPAVTPDPTATPSPDPVGAVPEPATWLSMMLGFFVLGTLLRRQRARSIELQAIARQSDGPHLG